MQFMIVTKMLDSVQRSDPSKSDPGSSGWEAPERTPLPLLSSQTVTHSGSRGSKTRRRRYSVRMMKTNLIGPFSGFRIRLRLSNEHQNIV